MATINFYTNKKTEEISIDTTLDIETALTSLVTDDGFNKVMSGMAEQTYPCQFSHGNDTHGSEEWAKKLFNVFQKGGKEAVEDMLIENTDQNDDHFYAFQEVLKNPDWDELKESLESVLQNAFTDETDIADKINDLMTEHMVELIAKRDDSVPLDALSPYLEVELCYIPGYGESNGLEDMWITNRGVCSSATDVIPDNNLANFLRFVNVSSDEYIHAAFKQSQANLQDVSEDWKTFSVKADLSKPALISAEDVVEILDNATYGGVPVIAFRTNLKSLIEQDFSADRVMKLETASGADAVAQIGIHDFINGSGHLATFKESEITLPANLDDLACTQGNGWYGIESVYGLMHSYMTADVTTAPAPEPDAQIGMRF
jgi:hypothetical protein